MEQDWLNQERQKDLDAIEEQAGRLLTVREIYNYGFKAGLSSAGLTSHSDRAYELWLWSREGTHYEAR